MGETIIYEWHVQKKSVSGIVFNYTDGPNVTSLPVNVTVNWGCWENFTGTCLKKQILWHMIT